MASQDDVAHALDMKRANVANYEAGRTTPPSDIIGRLADMLHTSADYLLGRTDNPLALHAAGTIRNGPPPRTSVISAKCWRKIRK